MRALHVVQLDLIVAAARPVSGGAKQNAAVMMPGVADVHLQFEIAELFLRGEVADAIRVQHAAQRLEQRLAIGDVPFGEIGRRLVERRPHHFRGKLADPQVAESDRVGQRFEP